MKAAAPQPSSPLPKVAAAPLTPVLAETPPVEELDGEKTKGRDAGMAESLAERALGSARPKALVNSGYADLVGAARNQSVAPSLDVGASRGIGKELGATSSLDHHQTFTRVIRNSVHAEPAQSLQFKLATELVRDEEEEEAHESAVQRKLEPSLAGDAPVPPDDAPRAVQRKAGPFKTATTPSEVHEIARAGVDGASESLPHLDRIQPLLAPHDLSGVRTKTGGAAAEANARLGALGYTMGERIAFRSAPDVKLAAHEAAHVVRQWERRANTNAQVIWKESTSDRRHEAETDAVLEDEANATESRAAREIVVANQASGLDVLRQHVDKSVPASANTSLSDRPGSPLPRDVAAKYSSLLNADLSRVQLHTDEVAASAANAISARAFTVGQNVYFGSDNYDTGTSHGRHLLAHELIHTVQQRDVVSVPSAKLEVAPRGDPLEREADRGADALLRGEPMSVVSHAVLHAARDEPQPQPYSTSSSDQQETQSTGINSEQWVRKHSANLIAHIGMELSNAELLTGIPFLNWKQGKVRAFTIDFWSPFWAAQADAWNMLARVLLPDTPKHAVNAGRDCDPWDVGTGEWRDAVVPEFTRVLLHRLRESLARLLPRWMSVKNQLALRAESGDSTAARDPSALEVFASHPIDTYVLGALEGKLDLDLTAYRESHPGDAQRREIQGGLRTVTFAFLMDASAWNWIRVTSPVDATAEEVAKTLYGTETKAYLLTDAAPLFGYPRIDDLLLVHQRRYNAEGLKAKPDIPEAPVMHEDTPATQILQGPLAEEAALNQAKKFKPSNASPMAVLERMRQCVAILTRLKTEVQGIGHGTLGLSSEMFEPARQRVDERSKWLKDAEPGEVVQWDAQSQAQLALLSSAENGILMAAKQQEAFASFPAAKTVISRLAWCYRTVAQNSDLAQSGQQWLTYADEQSRVFPVTLMELLLANLSEATRDAAKDKTGVISPELHEGAYKTAELTAREAKLREKLVEVRDVVLLHPEQAKAALDPLFKEINDLQVEVTLVTDMDACDAAWRALHDSLSVPGAIRSLWGSGNTLLMQAMRDANQINSEWHAIYLEYKFGDKAKAKQELKKKSEGGEWGAYMARIKELIKDQATYDKWMTFALLVGIAIVTGGIGAYVEAAAGTAWGATAGFLASTAVEAAVFTTLSYNLVTKDPSLAGFFNDFGKNLLTFGGLKIISRIYQLGVGLEAAASAEGKVGEVLVQFVAMNGVALYEADQEQRKKTGQGLSMAEIADISFNNLAFVIAVSIGSKLAKPWITSMQLKGELQGNLAKIESTQGQLQALAEGVQAAKGKNPALARKMLAKQAELLALEEKTLTRLEELAKDPKTAKAAGLSPDQVKQISAARAELDVSLVQVQQAQIASQLEAVGANDFLCPRGSFFEGLKKFFVEQGATLNDMQPVDPVTGAHTVEVIPKDGSGPFRVTERMSEQPNVVGKTPELADGKTPTGGRFGFISDDTQRFLEDPTPSPEAKAIREALLADIKAKNDEAMYQKQSLLMRMRVRQELAKLRKALVGRRSAEVPAVVKVLQIYGLKDATPTLVDTVFGYVFDSSGLVFSYENYSAWTRLANGQGTVDDVRFMVHEMTELRQLQLDRSFDFMGNKLEPSTPEHDKWYLEFEERYLAAHSNALKTEYHFLADQIRRSTDGKESLSPEEVASIDSTRDEARRQMMLVGKDGQPHALADDGRFPGWQAKGAKTVSISEAEANRLGLSEKSTTLSGLLVKIKAVRISPAGKEMPVKAGQPIPAPKELEAFPGLKRAKPKTPVQGGGGLRKRWVDDEGGIYEWDSQHGTVERYNKAGKHLGEFDPKTGEQTKPADPTREVEP